MQIDMNWGREIIDGRWLEGRLAVASPGHAFTDPFVLIKIGQRHAGCAVRCILVDDADCYDFSSHGARYDSFTEIDRTGFFYFQ